MPYRAVLLLIPFLVLAEAPKAPSVPKKVDQALRQRASEFLQDQVDGNFRKALDLVAEDTQDYYLAANKTKLFSFKIDNIEYSDKFTKAKVDSSVERLSRSDSHRHQRFANRHLENRQRQVDVVLHAAREPFARVNGTVRSPKMPTRRRWRRRQRRLPAATSVNKKSLVFTAGKAAMEEVVFHNGNRGPVKLVSDVIGNPAEFAVEPLTAGVGADQDFTMKISYTPVESPAMPVKVRLTVEPFGQQILIPVTFASEPSPGKGFYLPLA